MITRTTVTDDDGTGTTGTIANQAWLTTFYDTLDARWSRYTYTLTGAQNNLDVDEADVVLLNSASASDMTGLAAPASPAKPGKITLFKNIHATSLFTFAHNSGSSSAGNKFFNIATSGATPVGTGGWIAYQYDDVNSRWNQIGHDQGAWIIRTFAAGNYTASAGTWTVASAAREAYWVKGRTMLMTCGIAGTTSGTPVTVKILIPNGFTSVANDSAAYYVQNNGAGGAEGGYVTTSAGGTQLSFQRFANVAFAAGTVTVNTVVTFEIN